MIAKSVNAAANPSSRGIGFKALNSIPKTEFVKFVNSSRGVSWEVNGRMSRDTRIDVLTYLMNLIFYNNYSKIAAIFGLDISLTDLTNSRHGGSSRA